MPAPAFRVPQTGSRPTNDRAVSRGSAARACRRQPRHLRNRIGLFHPDCSRFWLTLSLRPSELRGLGCRPEYVRPASRCRTDQPIPESILAFPRSGDLSDRQSVALQAEPSTRMIARRNVNDYLLSRMRNTRTTIPGERRLVEALRSPAARICRQSHDRRGDRRAAVSHRIRIGLRPARRPGDLFDRKRCRGRSRFGTQVVSISGSSP